MVEVNTILKQPLNLIFVAYVLVLVSFIFMIKSSYDMKGAYDYGTGLQTQCDTVFMERERADFHTNKTYNETVLDQFKVSYNYLIAVSVLLVMISYVLWVLFTAFAGLSSVNDKVSTNTYLYNITYTMNRFFWIPKYGYPLMILGAMGYLMSVWIKGNFTKSGNLSPFNDAVYKMGGAYTGKKWLLNTHYKYLGIIFGSIIVGTMLYNPVFQNTTITPIPSRYIGHIFVLYLILLIVLPVFVDVIADFQDIKLKYEDKATQLNESIKSIIQNGSEPTKTNLRIEIEKNIVKSDPKRLNGESGAPDLSNINNSEYKDVLYQYVMHVTNDTDIVGIAIPQELKSIIRPVYLIGEQTILLKRKLIDVYNRHRDGSSITKDSLNKNPTNNTSGDADLKPFLIPDVAIKMATNDPADNTIREKYLALLNAYIVNNVSFKHGNPLPDDIVKKMVNMRNESTTKEVINRYFTKVNSLIMFIIVAYAYYVYHNLYRNYPEQTIQKVALLAFVLLILLGFAGWFTKELWI